MDNGPVLRFLRDLEERPEMFYLDRDHAYTSVVAFLEGFTCGFVAAIETNGEAPSSLVPEDFTRFLLDAPTSANLGPKGWRTIIRERAACEAEAFALLFAELRRYWASDTAT